MQPRGDVAVCPVGHGEDPAKRQPLFVVTGASGAGKTGVFPFLAAELRECVVFDVDWLIDPFELACAPEPINWVAFRDGWLSVAHGVAQGDRATVLLSPFMPEQLHDLPARPWFTEIHFALLDCTDTTRLTRLGKRPDWRDRNSGQQLAFAEHLRTRIPTVVRTDDGTPAEAATALASWVRGVLGPPTPATG
jgi:hypothetical protein